MYRRSVAGQTLTFGVSGMLLNNSLIMFDRETMSLWSHLTGEALAGPMKGRRLPVVASVPQVKWRTVREQAPEARVLSVGGREDAPGDSYAGYHADPKALGVRPVSRRDLRLPGKALVVGVRIGKSAKAYPFSALGSSGVLNDEMDGMPLAVARSDVAGASAVYRRTVDGKVLEFEPAVVDGKLRDRTTGTTWDLLRGIGREGPLAGMRLEAAPFVNSYWFGWSDYYPETGLYTPPG